MAVAAALAVAGFHRASIVLGASPRTALRLSVILGLATMVWPYGTALYSEAWLAAAFVWAAAFLVEARNDLRSARWRVPAASLLLAVAGLTKPTALVIAPGFVVATLLDTRVALQPRWRAIAVLAAGIALAAAVQIGWNLYRFGQPLDFGYNLAGMILQPPARSFSLADVPRGLFVQLLTPGKSLFVWAPIALVTLLTARAWAPRERGLAAGLLTGTVLALPVPRRAVMAAAAAGFVIAALAASVSFLEDQSPFQTNPQATGPYYERIDPEPGRPWNRYRVDYIPFKTALTSGHWASASRAVGNGPDFFALHLSRARTSMPGGTAIPIWLPWALVIPWGILGLFAGFRLLGGDHDQHQDH
jgi:hypothetical protein